MEEVMFLPLWIYLYMYMYVLAAYLGFFFFSNRFGLNLGCGFGMTQGWINYSNLEKDQFQASQWRGFFLFFFIRFFYFYQMSDSEKTR